MPERDYEVIIDGYVYPDTVTITLANDRFIGSRDYVSKELHESVSAANHALQVENAKLRELAKLYADAVSLGCDICPYCDPDLCDTETVPMRDGCRLLEEMHELGVEVKQ